MPRDFENRCPSACKICGSSRMALAGTTDFNRVAETPAPFPPAGIPVDYWQCADCGFAWAPGFDDWSDEQFRSAIYNPELERVERLENAVQRADNVMPLIRRFVESAQCRRLLDFGCGPGVLVERMQGEGLAAHGYDRYYPGRDRRPDGRFDLVTCFEVFEHISRIDETIDDMLSFVQPDGILFIGTFLTARPLDPEWWYCSPRSGHIAFWTFPALSKAFNRRKMNVASDGKMFHFAFSDAAKAKMQAVSDGR